jgi:hypothetical protein
MIAEDKGAAAEKIAGLKGRTWVTRQGVHVDRIACSWHAVELDQGDPFAHIMLAFARGFQGNMKGAESELEEARHLAPRTHLTYFLLTQVGQTALERRSWRRGSGPGDQGQSGCAPPTARAAIR